MRLFKIQSVLRFFGCLSRHLYRQYTRFLVCLKSVVLLHVDIGHVSIVVSLVPTETAEEQCKKRCLRKKQISTHTNETNSIYYIR